MPKPDAAGARRGAGAVGISQAKGAPNLRAFWLGGAKGTRSHRLGEQKTDHALFSMRLISASTGRRYRVPSHACKLTPVTTHSRGIPCVSLLSLLRCCFV